MGVTVALLCLNPSYTLCILQLWVKLWKVEIRNTFRISYVVRQELRHGAGGKHWQLIQLLSHNLRWTHLCWSWYFSKWQCWELVRKQWPLCEPHRLHMPRPQLPPRWQLCQRVTGRCCAKEGALQNTSASTSFLLPGPDMWRCLSSGQSFFVSIGSEAGPT